MKIIGRIFFGILGVVLFPLTILLSFILVGKLEDTRNQKREDLFEQEEEQFTEIKIKLKASANPKNAEIFKVKTSFGETEVIRWNNKNKKVVVFVHGVLCDKFTSAKAVKLWSDNGYDVVSFDGYGWGSTRKYGIKTNYAGREQVRMLNAVITEVISKYKLSDVMLHGESMGGGTVYKYISMFGTGKIEKFVVDAGYLSFYRNFNYLAAEVITTPVAYMVYPTMWIPFLLKGYPIRNQISKKKLKNIDKKLIHIHSNNDVRVPNKYIKNDINYFANNSKIKFYEKDVRHVRGYYDAPDELGSIIKSFASGK